MPPSAVAVIAEMINGGTVFRSLKKEFESTTIPVGVAAPVPAGFGTENPGGGILEPVASSEIT